MKVQDHLISDFTDPRFTAAFRLYFDELGIAVRDWEGLWQEMNRQEGNLAWVRTTADGQTVGFLQFVPLTLQSWFFHEPLGFIREFWVAPDFRGRGHGSALLALAEDWFRSRGIPRAILTTDTAPDFYLRHGYRADPCYRPKNHDPVFVKDLG